uniref:EF-hand domain-containing protein n=1 Tax=Salarias fasciatus TaxID=181472 RepID=A0A672HUJ4_SALFA
MANKCQQPPQLHLAEVTASQFLDIWKHFDTDGNGYIEGKELENFFRELEISRRGAGVDPTNPTFRENMKEFMQKFDKNKDGRIEMSELAQILPTEENFLLCFRQFVSSSTEFMAAWRRYDTDRSGYIEANELKGFLSDLLQKANRCYDDQKLTDSVGTIWPHNRNPNFLQGVKLTSEQFNEIFTFYDKDGNGYIDEQELEALLRDLYQKHKKEVDLKNLTGYKESIMSLSDGGKLYRTELEIVLCREPIL